MLHLCRWLLLVTVSTACTQELDIALPVAPPQLVLNGLLHPDSTIQVSLTTTLSSSTNSTDFPVVENATVRIYENEELLNNLAFQDSIYVLDYYPKVGAKYRIEAEVAGYPTIQAFDVVPNPPNVEVCFREDTARRYAFSDAILSLHIDDPVDEENFYWLDVTGTYPEYSRCRIKEDSIVWKDEEFQRIQFDTIVCEDNGSPTFYNSRRYFYQSFSSVPDRFNAYVDNTSGGVTEYEGYMRVEDAALNGEVISFDIAINRYDFLTHYQRIHEELAVTATIASASSHYDRYLKSSITYHLNRLYSEDEDLGFKPFVQSSQVYSNIENGTGIFAAYNTTNLDIGSYPCK